MKIRYYGHNGILTGYGRAADEMVEALAAAGAELEVRPLSPPASWNRNLAVSRFFKEDAELTRPDRIIVHTLPLDIGRAIGALPPNVLDLPHIPVVAYTTWEALDVPHAVQVSLAEADAIWVPSEAAARAIPAVSAVEMFPPVRMMPHAYDDTIDHVYTGERPQQPFTFYYVGAWTARKNPMGLVRAFCHAFSRTDDVQLLLHCRGAQGDHLIAALAQTGLEQSELPRVRLSTRDLSEPELWQLHGILGDVFVTATRGEAWNLPAFEAMLARRHIITPDRLGSDEFLRDTSVAFVGGYPAPAAVDIRPIQTEPGRVVMQVQGAQGLTARCRWQDPDLCDLARRMQMAYEARQRDLEVHYDVAAEFGRKAVGQRALDLLKEIKIP